MKQLVLFALIGLLAGCGGGGGGGFLITGGVLGGA